MAESVRSGGEAGSSSFAGLLFHHWLVNRVRLTDCDEENLREDGVDGGGERGIVEEDPHATQNCLGDYQD